MYIHNRVFVPVSSGSLILRVRLWLHAHLRGFFFLLLFFWIHLEYGICQLSLSLKKMYSCPLDSE